MSTPLLCLLAGLSMIAQDVLLTLMVQAENRHHWVIAGLMDTAGYLTQVVTFGVSINAVVTNGFDTRTLWVLISLSAANFIGTGLGTVLGDRWIHADNLSAVKPSVA